MTKERKKRTRRNNNAQGVRNMCIPKQMEIKRANEKQMEKSKGRKQKQKNNAQLSQWIIFF